ncbi:MAG TPA: TIGR03016 family PEP-CTERM system-associated outer membrane protein, partial [Gammaproteobacteria bacterium]|nr:TIGR03016 family PEP-CTERM system-associated outer membrane protein [Gammaproteobacteria bacterium]
SMFGAPQTSFSTAFAGEESKTRETRKGEWVVEPRLTVGETITDNVTLAPPGKEEWDMVSQITPGIGIRGDGPRLQGSLDYQAQSLFYVRNPNDNGVFHQLGADGTAEVLRHHVSVDASAAYTQQIISPTGPVPTSNIVPTSNRTNVGSFRVSPYAVQRFGTFADGRLRYTYDRVQYSTGSLADSETNGIHALLKSGPQFDDLGWKLRYHRSKERLQGFPDNRFERYSGELSYRLGAKTEAFGTLGYEDNKYQTRRPGMDLSSRFWETGLRYHPTLRTSLEGAYGKRYFGHTWRAKLRHHTRDSVWFLQYAESIETTSGVENQNLQLRLTDSSGNIITDSQGNPVTVQVPFTLRIQDVFLRRRLNAEITFHTAKSRIRFSGYRETRHYQRTGVKEKGYGAGAGLNWKVAPRTRAITRLSWDHHDLAFLANRKDDYWRVGARLARKLRPKLISALDYEYLRRDSNIRSAEYRQNAVSLLLTKVF